MIKKSTITAQNIGMFGALAFIFFSVVPYAVAGRHIASGLMLFTLIILLFKREFQIEKFGILGFCIVGIVGIGFLSSIFGPCPLESINVYRKETLPFVVALLLLLNRSKGPEHATKHAQYALVALLAGYLVKESFAVLDAVRNDFYSVYEADSRPTPKYLDFFSTDTIFYLPYLGAAIYFYKTQRAVRLLFVGATIVAGVFIVLSGSRTSFAIMLVIATVFFMHAFWKYRVRLSLTIVAFFLVAGLAKPYVTNISLNRLYTTFSFDTFKFGVDNSVSGRQAIAHAVWEISRERMILGYGHGWRKLPRIAQEGGYMDRWGNSNDPMDEIKFDYFQLGEGRVNPHNLYLQVIFEIGVLGLVFYITMLIVMLKRAIVGLFSRSFKSAYDRGMALATITFVLTNFGSGFSGGLWLPPTLLVALLWAQSRPTRSNRIGVSV